jgi:hypothetical protein
MSLCCWLEFYRHASVSLYNELEEDFFIDKNHQWTEVNRPVLVNTTGVYLHGSVYFNINAAVIQTYQTPASVIQLSLEREHGHTASSNLNYPPL